jgi:hypothetical protein
LFQVWVVLLDWSHWKQKIVVLSLMLSKELVSAAALENERDILRTQVRYFDKYHSSSSMFVMYGRTYVRRRRARDVRRAAERARQERGDGATGAEGLGADRG